MKYPNAESFVINNPHGQESSGKTADHEDYRQHVQLECVYRVVRFGNVSHRREGVLHKVVQGGNEDKRK
jgi:hypothetical protein